MKNKTINNLFTKFIETIIQINDKLYEQIMNRRYN